jgi:hypothetical protein
VTVVTEALPPISEAEPLPPAGRSDVSIVRDKKTGVPHITGSGTSAAAS